MKSESSGVRVFARSRSWTRSLSFNGDSDSVQVLLLDYTLSLVLRSFAFVQFNSQVKFCLHTTVDLLLEEFRISLKSSLSTQSVCHTISPQAGVGV